MHTIRCLLLFALFPTACPTSLVAGEAEEAFEALFGKECEAGLVAGGGDRVLVNRDSVRHSLGRVEGQDAGFPSDLTLAWRGAAHREGDVTFFRSKISW
jgi:hypothetical protein